MTETPLDETVMYALIKAAKAYLRAIGTRLAPLGLQPGQDMLLRHLWLEDGLAQSELVRRLMVEPPTVTKALRRLEKDGLVVRRREPKDGRLLRVYLTARAKQLEAPVTQIWYDVEAQGIAGLSKSERQELRRLSIAAWAGVERK